MDNRRETIVVNKRFQYQSSLMIASVAVLLTNAILIGRLVFPGDAPITLTSSDTLAIGIAELLLIAAIWYVSLRTTHRIAGPVFVFNRELQRVGEGDLRASIELREKDMFHEEAREINASLGSLRQRISTVKSLVEKIEQTHTSGGDISDALQQLQSEVEALKTGDED